MSPFHPATIPPGASPLSVIGPYPVAWNTPGLATGVNLASLSNGQLVLSGWAIQQVGFNTGGFFTIGVSADPGFETIAALSVPGQGTPAGLYPFVFSGSAFITQCVVVGAGTLVAQYDQGPTQGLVDVYALTYTP